MKTTEEINTEELKKELEILKIEKEALQAKQDKVEELIKDIWSEKCAQINRDAKTEAEKRSEVEHFFHGVWMFIYTIFLNGYGNYTHLAGKQADNALKKDEIYQSLLQKWSAYSLQIQPLTKKIDELESILKKQFLEAQASEILKNS